MSMCRIWCGWWRKRRGWLWRGLNEHVQDMVLLVMKEEGLVMAGSE